MTAFELGERADAAIRAENHGTTAQRRAAIMCRAPLLLHQERPDPKRPLIAARADGTWAPVDGLDVLPAGAFVR